MLKGKSMRQLTALVCLAAGFSLLAAAQSSLGLLQPDAGFVAGIEWRRLVDSGIGSTLTDQFKKADLTKIPGVQGAVESLFRDLDSVLIAAPASGLSKNSSQPPILVIVKG